MERIEITLPLPPKALHPNARKHWRAKLQPKKKARVDAHLAAKAAIDRAGMRCAPGWGLAEIRSTWYLSRRNDPDNLIAWAKSYFDGFADATLIVNDSGFCYWQPQQVIGKAANGRREVVFEITERKSA